MTNCSTKFTHQNLLAAGSDRIDFTAHRITDASQNDFFLPPQTKRNHSIFPSSKLLFQENISKADVCKALFDEKGKIGMQAPLTKTEPAHCGRLIISSDIKIKFGVVGMCRSVLLNILLLSPVLFISLIALSVIHLPGAKKRNTLHQTKHLLLTHAL